MSRGDQALWADIADTAASLVAQPGFFPFPQPLFLGLSSLAHAAAHGDAAVQGDQQKQTEAALATAATWLAQQV